MYKANWNPEPMVYIASRRMVRRKEAVTDIKVYSNCRLVTLRVNGRKIADMQPDNIKVSLFKNVHLKKGRNKIEVTGKTVLGNELKDICEWFLE